MCAQSMQVAGWPVVSHEWHWQSFRVNEVTPGDWLSECEIAGDVVVLTGFGSCGELV